MGMNSMQLGLEPGMIPQEPPVPEPQTPASLSIRETIPLSQVSTNTTTKKVAPYANILNYTTPGIVQQPVSNTEGGGFSYGGDMGEGWTQVAGRGGENGDVAPTWQYTPPDNLKDFMNPTTGFTGGNEGNSGSSQTSMNIDYSKLPNQGKTVFGSIDGLTAASDPKGKDFHPEYYKNPSLIAWDDNFGWITPLNNRADLQHSDTIGKINDFMGKYGPKIAMTAASAGFGTLAIAPMLAELGVGAGTGWSNIAAKTAIKGAKYGLGQGIKAGNSLYSGAIPTSTYQKPIVKTPVANQTLYTGAMPTSTQKPVVKPPVSSGPIYTGKMPAQKYTG